MTVVKTILMLIKRQNNHNIDLVDYLIMVFFLSVLGVMTTLMEFTVLETRNTIVKMEEMWTSHVYLGFHRSLEGFLNELKNDIMTPLRVNSLLV